MISSKPSKEHKAPNNARLRNSTMATSIKKLNGSFTAAVLSKTSEHKSTLDDSEDDLLSMLKDVQELKDTKSLEITESP